MDAFANIPLARWATLGAKTASRLITPACQPLPDDVNLLDLYFAATVESYNLLGRQPKDPQPEQRQTEPTSYTDCDGIKIYKAPENEPLLQFANFVKQELTPNEPRRISIDQMLQQRDKWFEDLDTRPAKSIKAILADRTARSLRPRNPPPRRQIPKERVQPPRPLQAQPEIPKVSKGCVPYLIIVGLTMHNAKRKVVSQDIYQFARHYFPGCTTSNHYKNSVRHIVCKCPIFKKLEEVPGGKSNYWTMDPKETGQFWQAVAQFERTYPDASSYGMLEPHRWREIKDGRAGLPAGDIDTEVQLCAADGAVYRAKQKSKKGRACGILKPHPYMNRMYAPAP